MSKINLLLKKKTLNIKTNFFLSGFISSPHIDYLFPSISSFFLPHFNFFYFAINLPK